MNKVIITGKKDSKIKTKKSPINKSLEKYKTFLGASKKDIPKDRKVIQVKRKIYSPKIKKKETDIKDINDVEKKMMKMKSNSMTIQMPTQRQPFSKEQITKVPMTKERLTKERLTKEHITKEHITKARPTKERLTKELMTKERLTKEPVPKSNVHRKSSRSNKRMTHRKKSKIQGRKISIKSGIFNKDDILKVESKIKEIRKKKHEDIKKELQDQGIKVSGKSNRLLKDIYFYSKVCNINIKHE